MTWTAVSDFPSAGPAPDAGREYARALERGEVLYFERLPYELPEEDREWMLSLPQTDATFHKNVSYRPTQDILRGLPAERKEEVERMHRIMREYSGAVTRFVARLLPRYAALWKLDFASFRPVEEEGRKLSLHKRNDLLHVDAFPSRPTHGARILRVFTNLNPTVPRRWVTTGPFEALARQYAADAGLARFAERRASPLDAVKRALGIDRVDRSPYDAFMLRFHDYLKENAAFQEGCPKNRMEFPPGSTWLVFTDAVAHAALSGQFAVEQTYIVPVEAQVEPETAPVKVLERLCGKRLV